MAASRHPLVPVSVSTLVLESDTWDTAAAAWIAQVPRKVHISNDPLYHRTDAPDAGGSPPQPIGLSAAAPPRESRSPGP